MKEYNFKEIEAKWQKKWEEKNYGQSEDFSDKPKHYNLVEFPYPSGAGLHVGHCMGYGASDTYCRMKRMQGYNVMYPIGWDAFGLPTENYAIKHKIKPQAATSENVANFKKQMKSLGYSFDWSREINTTDPAYYKWTQWIFLQFYRHALVDGKLVEVADDDTTTPRMAYQAEMPVNWCPSCRIILANEEVIAGNCERCGTQTEKRKQKQWMLRITAYADRLIKDLDTVDYLEKIKTQQINWIGKSVGSEIRFQVKSRKLKVESNIAEQFINVFTTRADTLFGCTYVVLAPEHPLLENIKHQISNIKEVEEYIDNSKKKSDMERTELAKEKTGVKLEGLQAVNPINNEKIDIYIADYVLANYGTGAVMAVPAHDERDWEFAKKYGIEIKEVIIPKTIDKVNPPQDGKEVVERRAIQGILIDPKTNKVLMLKWKKFPWTTFITGGVEKNEDVIEAAKREIIEETGYQNIKYIKTLGGPVESHFYAAHKGVNRKALFSALVFELIDDKQIELSDEEKSIHDLAWMSWDEIAKDKNLTCAEYEIWLDRFNNPEHAFTEYGVLINSNDFDGLTSEDAKTKITEKIKEIGQGDFAINFKLRDWIFSRQHYWGEPIPIVHCEDCAIKTKVILAHGISGNNEENWFPWFKKTLESRGYEVVIPNLPNTDNPNINEWIEALKENIKEKDKLILIGHSLGAPAVCQLIIKNKIKVEKLILVAPTGPSQNEESWKNLKKVGFDDKDLEIIKSFNKANINLTNLNSLVKEKILYLSDNDPYIPLEIQNDYKDINPRLKIFSNKGHFNHGAGIIELEEILEEFPTSSSPAIVPVPEEQLPITLPDVENYEPTETGESPLAKIDSWVNTTCPKCGGKAKRETDTMPNWAGSSWYFLRYCDPTSDCFFKKPDYFKQEIEWTQKDKNYFEEFKKVYSDLDEKNLKVWAANRFLLNGINKSLWLNLRTISLMAYEKDLKSIFTYLDSNNYQKKSETKGCYIFENNDIRVEIIGIYQKDKVLVSYSTEGADQEMTENDLPKLPLARLNGFYYRIVAPSYNHAHYKYIDKNEKESRSGLGDVEKIEFLEKYMETVNRASQYWMPVDLYNGGSEHITLHLLYSRFWHKFLFDLGVVPGPEPYAKRILHGIILGPDGQKMSKSRGNVINPDEIVKQFGADTLRAYIMFIGPYDQESAWSLNGVQGVHRFLKRVWANYDKVSDKKDEQELLVKLHQTIDGVTDDIENFRLNTVVSKLMEMNNMIEKVGYISKESFQIFLKLLFPVAPHIADELWQMSGKDNKIENEPWPIADKNYLTAETVKIAIQINGKTRDIIEVNTDAKEEVVAKLARSSERVSPLIKDKTIIKTIYVPARIINFVIK